jgi:hypothetical protein
MNEASRPRSPKVKQVLPLVQQDSKWQYLLTTISCQEQGSFEALLGWHHLAISYPMKKVKPIPNHIYPKYIPKHIPYISPKYPCKLPPPPSGPHFVGLKWSRWGIPIYKMKSYAPSYNPGCLQNVSLQGTQQRGEFHQNRSTKWRPLPSRMNKEPSIYHQTVGCIFCDRWGLSF